MGYTKEKRILNQGKPKAVKVEGTPISSMGDSPMIIPNHSGITSHPEFQENVDQYIKKDGTVDLTATWTITQDISIDSDSKGIIFGDDQDCTISWDNTEGALDIDTGLIVGGTGTSRFNRAVESEG